MPMGYNHNLRYHGRLYHAQTEACAGERPVVVTHLFLQGIVVANLRRDYQSHPGEPEHDDRLRRQMQEQHKEMMRYLHRGELDARIAVLVGEVDAPGDDAAPVAEAAASPEPPAAEAVPAVAAQAASVWSEPTLPRPDGEPVEAEAPPEAAQPEPPPPVKTLKLPLPLPPPPAGLPLPSPAAVAAARSKSVGIPKPARPKEQELLPEQMGAKVEEAELAEALTEAERRIIKRGRSISLEVASVELPVGKRIPFDHPAFQGFPMLDLDLGGEESLELDLDAVSQLDLDQPLPKVTAADDQREPLELADPWPIPEPEPPVAEQPLPEPPPLAAPRAAEPSPRTPSSVWRPAPPAGKPAGPRVKKPSLPMAPVVTVDLPDEEPDGPGRKR